MNVAQSRRAAKSLCDFAALREIILILLALAVAVARDAALADPLGQWVTYLGAP